MTESSVISQAGQILASQFTATNSIDKFVITLTFRPSYLKNDISELKLRLFLYFKKNKSLYLDKLTIVNHLNN